MRERIVIIDGNSLINRAFYAIQRPMITKDGMYTQGIYGFISMLTKIRSEYTPTHMLVAFDRKAPTFRHLEYKEYKAGRRKMPLELAMEMPVLKDVLDAMGIFRCEMDGFEADDLMGTASAMAEEAGIEAFVITGDKDALQLATDKTSVIITKKGITDFKLYDDAAMMEEYGFDHIQFIDYKGLRGDTSDNIPGVPGVGEKTAVKLIQQFGSIDEMVQHTDRIENAKLREKIEDNLMTLMMSKRLATIIRNVPVEFTMEDCRIGKEDTDRLIDLYSRLEFRTYLKKLLDSGKSNVLVTAGSAGEAGSSGETGSAAGPSAMDPFSSADPSAMDPAAAARQVPDPEKDCTCGFCELSFCAEENRTMEKALASGEFFIYAEGDDSHISGPRLSSLAIAADHTVFYFEGAGLTEDFCKFFSGKELKLHGFGLGRIFYVLYSYGADASRITAAGDSSIGEYLLSPSGKAKDLDTVLLERYHFQSTQAPAQQSFLDMFSESRPDMENLKRKIACLMKLEEDQEAALEKQGLMTVYQTIELPLCKVLASMEAEGIAVDRNALKAFGDDLKKGIAEKEKEIYQLAGESFNINSPMQLGNILFEKLGLPGAKKTKKGYSTSADVLEKLAGEYPIVSSILEYRTLSKLNSTYVESMLPLIDEGGRVHAHFQQTVTATGRISCTEPNLQNIPVRTDLGRQLRKAFTAGSDDYVLIGADYSQIELRILAHMSGDETLIAAFNNGHDIHRETAAKVFGVPLEQVTAEMRSNAKAVNFGVIYGMSGFGLATELTISRKQAEKYIKDYFVRFSRVKTFMDEAIASCKETGVSRTMYGRKRSVPEISASQFMVRQLGERLAMNTPIQGTAADIIKLAMNKVFDALEKECPGSKLILQIHDELIIQARRSEKEKVIEVLSDCMKTAAKLSVSLEISLNEGENWYQLK